MSTTEGNLAEKAALSLMTELNRKKATGTLRFVWGTKQKAVYFQDGQILFAASNETKDQLASILVEEGKLGPDQIDLAKARVSAGGKPLAKVLTELGYLSERELEDAARLKVEKILTDLFGWKEGTYQFAENALPKTALPLKFSTPQLMFNSMQRMDDREWVLRELGSLDATLSPDESLEMFLVGARPDDKALDVLRLVDGVKTVKQIGALSALSEFAVCKVLAAAAMLGAVRKAAVPPAASSPVASAPPEPPPFEETLIPEPEELPEAEDLGVLVEPTERTSADSGRLPFPFDEEKPRAASLETEKQPLSFLKPDYHSPLLEEPEPRPASAPASVRTPPRPRRMKEGAGSRVNNKLILSIAAVALLAVGGAAGYYLLWPLFRPEPVRTEPRPTQKAPKQTPDAETTPSPDTTGPTQVEPAPESAVTVPPDSAEPTPPALSPSAETPPQAAAKQPPSAEPKPKSQQAPPAQLRPSEQTSPQATARPPATTRQAPTDAASPLQRGGELLRSGRYSEAGASYLQHFRGPAAEQFTITIGVYCDEVNVKRAFESSGRSEQMLILPVELKGRSCYRVFWGLYASRDEALRSVAKLPPDIRSAQSSPVQISQLIR